MKHSAKPTNNNPFDDDGGSNMVQWARWGARRAVEVGGQFLGEQKNGWRREAAICGGASRDLANEPDGTHVPIFCKQRDGGPRGAYGDAIVH